MSVLTVVLCCGVQFFQQDNGMGDVFMMGTLVAALYLAYRVFAEIENLH